MNFRITTLYFGILLTMLWVFGLMIAQKKTSADRSFIVPSLQLPDIKIDKVQVKKAGKDSPEIEFVQISDNWFLKAGKQQVRVENFRINQIISQIKDAKHEETTDVSKDLKQYGLDQPQLTVTLSGKRRDDEKEWKFFVGKDSVDKTLVYVTSSDRQDKAFAVPKRSIENLLFKDPNYLRSKRVFDYTETAVTSIQLQKGGKEVELKRGENNLWSFVKPPLGFAGFDAQVEEKKEEKFPAKQAEAISGVKNLLSAISAIRVEEDDDFVPLGKEADTYGLETDKANFRIDINTTNDKKEVKETLLIGDKVPNRTGDFYYARLASDDGVMQIDGKWLAPIDKAVQDPGKIRSLDVAVFETKNVDFIVLKQGKTEIKFFKPENETAWQMYVNGEKKTPDEKAVTQLLEQVHGKKAIVGFDDIAEADVKKRETEWGLDTPTVEVAVYLSAIEKDKKDEKKEDEDKKDAKKEEIKKESMPVLKKDAKAVITLAIGKTDKELIHVRRTLEDGTVSRFTVKKEFAEKIAPPEGIALAYLDTSLPITSRDDIVSLELVRTTEKGTEKQELQRRFVDEKGVWSIKDSLDPTGFQLAENKLAERLASSVATMQAKKWLRKITDKDDLDKYGLKNPVAIATLTVKKHPVKANVAASVMGLLGGGFDPGLLATVAALSAYQADKGEVVTIKFGKETDQDKDKPAVFAQHSGSDLLFLADVKLLKEIKEADLHDRTFMLNAHAKMAASYLANAAGDPLGLLLLASPQISGTIHRLDADKVKEIRLSVRTPFELRSFGFTRNAKDKTWKEAASLQEFNLDSDKVNQLVKDLCKLHTDRFVAFAGGARSEYKLRAKEASVKIELVLDNDKTVTLTIGTNFQNHGYFANSSLWPETVFFLPSTMVEPLLRGVAHFGKERVAGN